MLVAALWWARQGIDIFPLRWPVSPKTCSCPDGSACASPGKHPMTARGLHDATTDEDTIRAWWTRWPSANIGMPTGRRFDVVDIDGASQAWNEFVAERGTPEHLGVVMSGRPSGGFHFYCAPGGQATIPSGTHGLPKGVEIKGVGGYVVVPPSMHEAGRPYTWIGDISDGVVSGDTPWSEWFAHNITPDARPRSTELPAAPRPTPAPFDTGTRAQRYGQAVLDRAVSIVTDAGEGGRWNALALEAAPLVARAIAGGCLDRAAGQRALEDASRAAGLTRAEESRVGELLDRLDRQGITHPIAPPQATTPLTTQPDAWAGLITQVAPDPDYVQQVSEDVERTSWWPRDLAATIGGHDPEPDPAHLYRDDERALFYPGKVNGLIGESESGKTWIALLAVAQALAAGQTVTYLDFEDTASGIIGRLAALAVTPAQLALLAYISPDESLHSLAKRDLADALAEHQPNLVVLDGFNAAMTLLGLDLNSNTDATAFSQQLLKPLAKTGAAVVYVDHVPKAKESRGKGGIGAQAKRAMTTGCALTVEVVAPFGRGMTGKLRLTVDKDRPGKVRAISAAAKYAGEAILTSQADGAVTVSITAPDLRPSDERGPFRPTHLMAKVSEFLSSTPDGASTKAIEEAVIGKRDGIRKAIERLVVEGHVARVSGPRGAVIHVLEKPFHAEFDMGWEDDE